MVPYSGYFRGAHILRISCKGPSSLTLKFQNHWKWVWSIRVQLELASCHLCFEGGLATF